MTHHRKFDLTSGAQDMIGLALNHLIDERVQNWREQVANGEIDEQARSVFVSLGWITPRDGRVTVSRGTATPRKRKSENPPEEEAQPEPGPELGDATATEPQMFDSDGLPI